jgi:hypothetical protein
MPAHLLVRSSRTAHQWAIVSAGLAPVLLTGGYLVSGALQPGSYSPVRETISAMAGQAGTGRWIMTGGLFPVAGCYLPEPRQRRNSAAPRLDRARRGHHSRLASRRRPRAPHRGR